VFDGVSDATDYELTQLLPASDYNRFQVELIGASDSLDNANEKNLEGLQDLARAMITKRSADLDRLASELTS